MLNRIPAAHISGLSEGMVFVRTKRRTSLFLISFIYCSHLMFSQTAGTTVQTPVASFPLNSLHGLDAVNGKAEITTYRGRPALHLVPLPEYRNSDGAMLAILTERDFKHGTIEVEVAGSRRADSAPDERGFIGVAFRVEPHGSKFEYIYLRPLNGRTPMINCAAITPSHIPLIRIFPGIGFVRRTRDNTSPMSISNRACGRR